MSSPTPQTVVYYTQLLAASRSNEPASSAPSATVSKSSQFRSSLKSLLSIYTRDVHRVTQSGGAQSQTKSQEKRYGGVMHRFADDVVELVEKATRQRAKRVKRAQSENPVQNTDAPAAPATTAASSQAFESATSNTELPFDVSYDMHEMLVQLLLLFTQYLPPFYAMHWEAANPTQQPSSTSSSISVSATKRTRQPVPLPPGTDVDSFQAWFRRVDTLAQLVLVNRSEKQYHSDSEMLYLLAFHLRVQTMYHSPAVITNVDAFWTQVNQLLNDPDAKFTACLRDEYPDTIELLSTLTTLIIVTNDHSRLAIFSERLLTIWLVDPLPTTSGTPHHKSFHVFHFSPSLSTHECIQTILSMCVEGMLNIQKRVEKEKKASDASIHSRLPVGQTEKQIVRLIELTGIGSSTIDPAHLESLPRHVIHLDISRSTLNLYALIGILHGTRLFLEQFDASSTFRSTDSNRPTFMIEAVQTNGVHKLLLHLRNLIGTLPEIKEFTGERSVWPCSDGPINSATSSDSKATHSMQDIVISQSCPSCQFLLILTTALTHSTVWINPFSRLRNGFDEVLSKLESDRKSPFAVMMQMVTRVALHLMDTTWIFNECFRDTDNANDKLSVWFTSPYFRLLPHYRKAMERLFLLFDESEEEHAAVNLIWRRVKYMHHVWKWWYVFGAQMNKPSSAGTQKKVDDTEKRALVRLKHVTMMQPTNNPVQLDGSSSSSTSTTPPSPPSTSSSSSTLRPLLLRPTSLIRAQRSLSLLTMFFAKILQHEKWTYRGLNETVSTNSSSNEFKSHVTTLCQIIDITADLEFIFSSNQLTPSAETQFQPHQQMVKIITALVNGQEIQMSGGETSSSTTSPQISTEARQRFGEYLVSQYICSFLRPPWKYIQQPVSVRASSRIFIPFELTKDFGFESARKNGPISTSTLFRRTFAPHILSHDIFTSPDHSVNFPTPHSSDNTWKFIQESSIMRDTPYTQRVMFLTKYVLTESVLEKIPWRVQYHVLLRWTWMHTNTKSVMLKDFQQNVVQLCMRIIENGFAIATAGNTSRKEILSDAWSSAVDLSSPVPLQLETFLRTLLPHLVTHVTVHYPSSTSFTCLCHVYLRIFGGKVMMQNDPMLLVFMKQLYERIVQMTEGTTSNKEKMKEWRKVLKDDGSITISDSDDSFLPIPPHLTSLPDQFPQLVPIRRLMLLYMQLIQYLDVPTLFPHALTYLDTFFREVMNPQKDAIYTPIRASFAHLLYLALSGRFNLTKRDVMMKWIMDLVEELNIPVGIKEIVVAGADDGKPDGQHASDGDANDSTSKLRRNLAALKKAVENR